MLSPQTAKSIADLINSLNELTSQYSQEAIIEASQRFVIIEEEGSLIACAEVKKVQWYQHEICHLSVLKDMQGKGFGKKILKMAELKAITAGARIIQCTIRSSNMKSSGLFNCNGYHKTSTFFNRKSANWVDVYQKVVTIEYI